MMKMHHKQARIGRGRIGWLTAALGLWLLLIPAGTLYGQEKTALDLLDEAMELKLSLAQQRYSVRDLDRVITLCEAALEAGLDPADESYAKELLTGALYEQAQMVIAPVLEGQLDRSWRQRRSLSLEAIQRAVEVMPDDAEAQLLLARIQGLPGGDKTDGLKAANRAVDLLDDYPERQALALMARAVFQESNEKRLADYDAAVELGEGNLEAYRERGRARLLAGELDEAAADFRHVLEEDPNDVEAIELLTQTLVVQEKIEEAIEQAGRLIEVNPQDVESLILRASLYVSVDRIDMAIADLNEALQREPANVDALLGRAALREATRDYGEAMADVGRALELRPGLPRALILRSQIATAAGDAGQAVRDLRQLIRREPQNMAFRMQLAFTYQALERPQEAIETYGEMLEIDDEYWQAVRGRGDAYLAVGNHAGAIADYRRALDQLPEDAGLLNNLAWVLATSPEDELRDGQEALRVAKQACEVSEYKEAHILSTLAAAHAELGDFEQAVEWSNKAIALESESKELREQLEGELEQYKAGKPWREKQEAPVREKADVSEDDLFVDEVEPVKQADSTQLP
ncbi:MAG: tetratricopeptide repeat protein [Planctomycetota bacterium]